MIRNENMPPEQPRHPIDVPVFDFVEPTPIESTTRGDIVIAILSAAVLIVIALAVML